MKQKSFLLKAMLLKRTNLAVVHRYVLSMHHIQQKWRTAFYYRLVFQVK
jgi:hypothetical protein